MAFSTNAMLTAYRIFKTKHAGAWFDGEGSFRFGGRWNSRGTRILYASSTLSLAALEMLVHLNNQALLGSYSYATIQFHERTALPVESIHNLPLNWRSSPVPYAVQRIGDEWFGSGASVVLQVPSAVVTTEVNYLINVNHADLADKVVFGKPKSFEFDRRLGTI